MMKGHKLSRADRVKGGRATAALPGGTCEDCGKFFEKKVSLMAHRVHHKPGGECERCGRTYKTYSALLGHKGLHGFADQYMNGDIRKAAEHFGLLGAIESDPMPENGAYYKGYELRARIDQHKSDEELSFTGQIARQMVGV